MLLQAQATPEEEVCGLLGGRNGQFTGIYPVKNIAADPVNRFLLDPEEQIAAMRTMRSQTEELLGIYHSHPHTGPVPSRTDRVLAAYPDLYYFIISLVYGQPELRMYFYNGSRFLPVNG